MQNLILFQTVINWDREYWSQPHKKLKNKENLIHADEFSFQKMKIFLSKVRPQSRRGQGADAKFNSLSNCQKFRWRILGLNRTRNWKIRKIWLVQTNSPFTKWKFFLSKVRPPSRRREGADAEFNSLSNCHKLRSTIWVSTAEETEK